jgi:transposase InsO family protein
VLGVVFISALCADKHSDNDSPMKSYAMLAKLHQLGIMTSFSRPKISNDSPYSESLFKTAKYHCSYLSKPFGSIEEARALSQSFV